MTQLLEPIKSDHSSATPQALRISVTQYEALGKEGLLPENVELIQGVIITMPPMGESHINRLDDLHKRCILQFHTRARITSQTPLRLIEADGEPEPNIMLCQPESRGVTDPKDVLLLIEISRSTYQTNRDLKLPMYAQYRIPEVWLVNLNQRQLEVYREPHQSSSGWAYAAPIIYKPLEHAAPLAFPDDPIQWW
jgi:Uma2 family endonuclease